MTSHHRPDAWRLAGASGVVLRATDGPSPGAAHAADRRGRL